MVLLHMARHSARKIRRCFKFIVLIVTPRSIHDLGVHLFCLLDLISEIMDFSNVGQVLIAGTGQVCPSTDDRFIDRTQMDWWWFIDLTAASLARLVFRCYTSSGVFSFFSFVFSSLFFPSSSLLSLPSYFQLPAPRVAVGVWAPEAWKARHVFSSALYKERASFVVLRRGMVSLCTYSTRTGPD